MGLGIGMELGMGRVGFDVRVLNPSKILLLDVEKGGGRGRGGGGQGGGDAMGTK